MAVPEFYSGKILYPAIGVLLFLSAVFGSAILPRLSSQQNALVGKPAPDFTLDVVANGDPGSRMKLGSLKNRVVVLDFWASWCGPCAAQAPIMDRLAREYSSRGVTVLGVNVDDSPEVIQRYTRNKGLSYPMLYDPMQKISNTYQVSALPSVVVINKNGMVGAYYTGFVNQQELTHAIETQ